MEMSGRLRTRREFLGATGFGTALALTAPAFWTRTVAMLQAQAGAAAGLPRTGADAPILVVLQLAGGNDGLNTVIPFGNDDYYRARPRLAIAAEKVLRLRSDLGLHPSLGGVRALWDDGLVAVVQGVGYPNPNRSHFRSTEIWQTASDADRFEKHGWLGRYFDHACQGAEPTVGVSIGRQPPQAFAAGRPVGVSLDSPERYRFGEAGAGMERGMQPEGGASSIPGTAESALGELEDGVAAGGSIGDISGAVPASGSPLDFLDRTVLDARLSSDRVRAVLGKGRSYASYPAGRLGEGLRLVGRLIAGGLATRVYYVSQGGYDTHTNQAGSHARLLQELGDGLKAFFDDLKQQGNRDRVLLMTFSEFGRRVGENANGGTDHGAAAPMLMVGSKLTAGIRGEQPSIAPSDLLAGDLKFRLDFRSVYSGVLERWLGTPSVPVLGRRFEPFAI
jgi:uncharacterized protein (DUF1501 family)